MEMSRGTRWEVFLTSWGLSLQISADQSPYRSQKISHLPQCFGKISVKRGVSGGGFLWLVVWRQSPQWQGCVAGTHQTLMIQEADMEEETKQAGHRGLPGRALPNGSATSPDSTSRRPSVQTQAPSEDFSQSNFILPKEKLDLSRKSELLSGPLGQRLP